MVEKAGVTTLKVAFKRLRGSGQAQLLLHLDQGWQYQMRIYQQALSTQGISQTMARKGNYLDNAVMENWFGIMKTEFFHRKTFDSTSLIEEGGYANISTPTTVIESKKKGIKPGSIPNSIPRANLIKLSSYWGLVQKGGIFVNQEPLDSRKHFHRREVSS